MRTQGRLGGGPREVIGRRRRYEGEHWGLEWSTEAVGATRQCDKINENAGSVGRAESQEGEGGAGCIAVQSGDESRSPSEGASRRG